MKLNLELKNSFSINVLEMSLQDTIESNVDLIKNGDLDIFQVEFSENVINESKRLINLINKKRNLKSCKNKNL